jgi:Tol biopolymer transport system component
MANELTAKSAARFHTALRVRRHVPLIAALSLAVALPGTAAAIPALAPTPGDTIRITSPVDPLLYGAGGPALSQDGNSLVYGARGDSGFSEVWLLDLEDGSNERISEPMAGSENDDNIGLGPSVSADGRYVAFASRSSALVPGDTNDALDVFVRDRVAGTTERVSVTSDEQQVDGHKVSSGQMIGSNETGISDDGRFVVFTSIGPGLTPEDTNDETDVFVRDRVAGTTSIVSYSVSGEAGNAKSEAASISADGRYVAFVSNADDIVEPGMPHGTVYVRDLQDGSVVPVDVPSTGTVPDASLATDPVISTDGRHVAFAHFATNLTDPPGPSGEGRLFVADLDAGTLDAVLVSDFEGGRSVAVSTDGSRVAAVTKAPDPGGGSDFHLVIFDRNTGRSAPVDLATSPCRRAGGLLAGAVTMSGDGALVAYHSVDAELIAGDVNEVGDVFLHTVDLEPPVVAAPSPIGLLSGIQMRANGRATFRIFGWDVVDGSNNVATVVQEGVDAADPVAIWNEDVEFQRTLDPGHRYRYGVSASDCAGHESGLAWGASSRYRLLQETAPRIAYRGDWRLRAASSDVDGASMVVRGSGASASFNTEARAFALVSRRGPQSGRLRVFVDGSQVAVVRLYRGTLDVPRLIVFKHRFTTPGRHYVRLVTAPIYGVSGARLDAIALVT